MFQVVRVEWCHQGELDIRECGCLTPKCEDAVSLWHMSCQDRTDLIWLVVEAMSCGGWQVHFLHGPAIWRAASGEVALCLSNARMEQLARWLDEFSKSACSV